MSHLRNINLPKNSLSLERLKSSTSNVTGATGPLTHLYCSATKDSKAMPHLVVPGCQMFYTRNNFCLAFCSFYAMDTNQLCIQGVGEETSEKETIWKA